MLQNTQNSRIRALLKGSERCNSAAPRIDLDCEGDMTVPDFTKLVEAVEALTKEDISELNRLAEPYRLVSFLWDFGPFGPTCEATSIQEGRILNALNRLLLPADWFVEAPPVMVENGEITEVEEDDGLSPFGILFEAHLAYAFLPSSLFVNLQREAIKSGMPHGVDLAHQCTTIHFNNKSGQSVWDSWVSALKLWDAWKLGKDLSKEDATQIRVAADAGSRIDALVEIYGSREALYRAATTLIGEIGSCEKWPDDSNKAALLNDPGECDRGRKYYVPRIHSAVLASALKDREGSPDAAALLTAEEAHRELRSNIFEAYLDSAYPYRKRS